MLVNVWLRVAGCHGGQCEARLGELFVSASLKVYIIM